MKTENIWIDVNYDEYKSSTYRGVFATKITHIDGKETNREQIGQIYSGDYEFDLELLKKQILAQYPDLDMYYTDGIDAFEMDYLITTHRIHIQRLAM